MTATVFIHINDEQIAEIEIRAYERKWSVDGETPEKVRGEDGRMSWPFKFKLLAITQGKCLADDEPLVKLSDVNTLLKNLAADIQIDGM